MKCKPQKLFNLSKYLTQTVFENEQEYLKKERRNQKIYRPSVLTKHVKIAGGRIYARSRFNTRSDTKTFLQSDT
jgi:hypothetical protein